MSYICKNMKSFFPTIIALASVLSAGAAVVTYPAGPGVETLDDFTVAVRQNGGEWQPVGTRHEALC